MAKLLIDVGSTYFKVCDDGAISHHFRNFDKDILDDLLFKCGDIINKHEKDEIQICSSANGGLSTLIIGLTESFSLKYASNIAYNSGINIIETVIYSQIESYPIPSELLDIVILVGGIDSIENIFDEKLISYLDKLNYSNIVYVGSKTQVEFLNKNISNLKVLPNIIDNKLKMVEEDLKEYLTNLYQADIMGKEDIKHLYSLVSNQIYSTPYIVNKSLANINKKLDVADPFIVVDIGGATTDIHYSKDLVDDNIITENGYDRLVFKKLGVYKSRESLIHTAKANEYVYELLAYLNTTENTLDEVSKKSTQILMQLAIFLVLYKVSHHHKSYLNIKLDTLNSIVLTGGITKVLSKEQIDEIISFFYSKLLGYHTLPLVVIDCDYTIWTLGMER